MLSLHCPDENVFERAMELLSPHDETEGSELHKTFSSFAPEMVYDWRTYDESANHISILWHRAPIRVHLAYGNGEVAYINRSESPSLLERASSGELVRNQSGCTAAVYLTLGELLSSDGSEENICPRMRVFPKTCLGCRGRAARARY